MIKNIFNCELEGVRKIELDRFEDLRGTYQESFNLNEYQIKGIKIDFVQDDFSISKFKVIRGLHGDHNTWKLVSCIMGEFFLAVVNFDEKSNQYCQHQTFTLNENDNYQILIPPKFANGHLVLSKKTIFHYKQSTYYDGMEKQFTLRWNDPKLAIKWPINDPILSVRDKEVSNI